MAGYWNIVNKVIAQSDVILLILDARMPEDTRHAEVEDKVRKAGKKLMYVYNKADLAPENPFMRYKPAVLVSSTKRWGGTKLYRKILELSKGKACKVGVVGYPNVGKSSVINLIKGKASAKVSSVAGMTRGVQWFKTGKVWLLDTPGVIPYDEKNVAKHVMIGTKNPHELRDPDVFAMEFIEHNPDLIEQHYGITADGDSYEILERLAAKQKLFIRGGKPDIERMSRKLLQDWQRGKLA
ncbi:50S ribosome-binding GTPase [Candidatus Woesearchaeota archaeon]|nr:50S ribosome-binding GTPase [Candidatus Woesearchaeota archaeon]